MFTKLLKALGHDTTSGQLMPGIDGVRALAVTMVVVFHIHGFGADSPDITFFGWLHLNPWLTTGHLGVPLFFALSGFLLMIPWAKNYHAGLPPPELKQYFYRRFMRIAPAYYAQVLFLFLVLAPLALPTWHLLSALGIFTVFTHLTFIHYLFPMTSAGLGINGALWTLTIEACFYVALPFVARFFLGSRAWIYLLLALLLAEIWKYVSFHALYDFLVWVVVTLVPKMAAYRYNPIVMKAFLANQLPSQAFNFALGMFMANVYCNPVSKWKSALAGNSGNFLSMALIGALGFMAWLLVRLDVWESWLLYVWFIPVSAVCAFLVFLASFPNFFADKVLGAAPVRILGIISYSVYLWHFPIIYFARNYWIPNGINGPEKFYYLLALCVPLTLLVGYFSYRYIELPFLSLAKNHVRK